MRNSVATRELTGELLGLGQSVNLYGKQRTARAYDRIVMSKSLKCPIRVVWVFSLDEAIKV
jgi:hypothetical protein